LLRLTQKKAGHVDPLAFSALTPFSSRVNQPCASALPVLNDPGQTLFRSAGTENGVCQNSLFSGRKMSTLPGLLKRRCSRSVRRPEQTFFSQCAAAENFVELPFFQKT